jgi:hypothetical protein
MIIRLNYWQRGTEQTRAAIGLPVGAVDEHSDGERLPLLRQRADVVLERTASGLRNDRRQLDGGWVGVVLDRAIRHWRACGLRLFCSGDGFRLLAVNLSLPRTRLLGYVKSGFIASVVVSGVGASGGGDARKQHHREGEHGQPLPGPAVAERGRSEFVKHEEEKHGRGSFDCDGRA